MPRMVVQIYFGVMIEEKKKKKFQMMKKQCAFCVCFVFCWLSLACYWHAGTMDMNTIVRVD
jgi:hypothetical protein